MDKKYHTISDELESLLWVMLWIAIRHAPSKLLPKERLSLLRLFDYESNPESWGLVRRLEANWRISVQGRHKNDSFRTVSNENEIYVA